MCFTSLTESLPHLDRCVQSNVVIHAGVLDHSLAKVMSECRLNYTTSSEHLIYIDIITYITFP